jgi:hypothetical protein
MMTNTSESTIKYFGFGANAGIKEFLEDLKKKGGLYKSFAEKLEKLDKLEDVDKFFKKQFYKTSLPNWLNYEPKAFIQVVALGATLAGSPTHGLSEDPYKNLGKMQTAATQTLKENAALTQTGEKERAEIGQKAQNIMKETRETKAHFEAIISGSGLDPKSDYAQRAMRVFWANSFNYTGNTISHLNLWNHGKFEQEIKEIINIPQTDEFNSQEYFYAESAKETNNEYKQNYMRSLITIYFDPSSKKFERAIGDEYD